MISEYPAMGAGRSRVVRVTREGASDGGGNRRMSRDLFPKNVFILSLLFYLLLFFRIVKRMIFFSRLYTLTHLTVLYSYCITRVLRFHDRREKIWNLHMRRGFSTFFSLLRKTNFWRWTHARSYTYVYIPIACHVFENHQFKCPYVRTPDRQGTYEKCLYKKKK